MREKFKQTKFYAKLQKLKKDMEPMTFWGKIDHIWYSYHVYIISIVVSLGILGIVLGAFIGHQTKEQIMSGILVNLNIDTEGKDYLTTDYEKYLNAENNQTVELVYVNFGRLDEYTMPDDYERALILIARVEGMMLDYMILDKAGMESYITYDVYADLRDFFTQEELAQLEAEQRVVYAQIEGEEERWPIAVKITDIPFVKDNVSNEGDIYFALPGREPNLERSRNAWNYLHAWESRAEQ